MRVCECNCAFLKMLGRRLLNKRNCIANHWKTRKLFKTNLRSAETHFPIMHDCSCLRSHNPVLLFPLCSSTNACAQNNGTPININKTCAHNIKAYATKKHVSNANTRKTTNKHWCPPKQKRTLLLFRFRIVF